MRAVPCSLLLLSSKPFCSPVLPRRLVVMVKLWMLMKEARCIVTIGKAGSVAGCWLLVAPEGWLMGGAVCKSVSLPSFGSRSSGLLVLDVTAVLCYVSHVWIEQWTARFSPLVYGQHGFCRRCTRTALRWLVRLVPCCVPDGLAC